jgi:hypothetical protein
VSVLILDQSTRNNPRSLDPCARSGLGCQLDGSPRDFDAAAEGLSLASEAERFRLHAEATGRLMANWNAAFTTWLINAKRFGPRVPAGINGRTTRAADLLDDQLKRVRELQEAEELAEALS